MRPMHVEKLFRLSKYQRRAEWVKKMSATVFLIGSMVLIVTAGTAFAAHLLVSDDTGTQGKGKFQIEVNRELHAAYSRRK